MQKIVLSLPMTATVTLREADTMLILDEGATLRPATGDGIVAPGDAEGRSIVVDGGIDTRASGIVFSVGGDLDSAVTISETGTITAAGSGLDARTDALDVTNRGTVSGKLSGMTIAGTATHVVNEGTITSSAGSALVLSGRAAMMINNGSLSAATDGAIVSAESAIVTNNGTIGAAKGRGLVVGGDGSTVTNNKTIGAAGHGILSTSGHQTITNYGAIGSGGSALVVRGADGIVTNAGTLNAGADGMALYGGRVIATNNKTIEVGSIAIRVSADDALVTNNGTLKGAAGISVTGRDAEVGNSGTITGWKAGKAAVDFSAAINGAFNNKGEVVASSGIAFTGGAGKQAVTNSGTLKGDVDLGAGNDYFDGTGGTVMGHVAGGAGNDTYVVGTARIVLIEAKAGGVDAVQSSVSFTLGDNFESLTLTGSRAVTATGNAAANQIHGNAAANSLDGKGGRDILWGHGGNDRLTGGAGADQFVFATGDGRDTISDFKATGASHDVLDLTGLASITTFADLKAGHMVQSGGDVLIDGLNGDGMLLSQVKLADLDKGDFYFV